MLYTCPERPSRIYRWARACVNSFIRVVFCIIFKNSPYFKKVCHFFYIHILLTITMYRTVTILVLLCWSFTCKNLGFCPRLYLSFNLHQNLYSVPNPIEQSRVREAGEAVVSPWFLLSLSVCLCVCLLEI